MRPLIIATSLSIAIASLSACGALEWPPQGYGYNGNTYSSSSNKSSAVFINASSVIVGKGDTIYALSKRHQVSARDIIEANNLSAPYMLQIGQKIILPRGQVHRVTKGDTLFGLSRQFNVDPYDLARANALKPPYTIYVGQELRMPGTVVAAKNANTTTKTNSTPAANTSVASTSTTLTKTKSVVKKAVPTPPPSTGKGFSWPVQGRLISSFGAKDGGLHNDGLNIAAPKGSPVTAAENGVVAYAGNELRGFGNLLLIKHANGYITAYAHNDELLVKRGQKVKKGQKIAKVGSTGNVTTPQLHFELRRGKKVLDPRSHLPKVNT